MDRRNFLSWFGLAWVSFGAATGGQVTLFTYLTSNWGAATITITATRKAPVVGTIAVDQAGTITKTGVYL